MKIILTQKIDIETLKKQLQANFTNYKIGHPPFNKKTIHISNGMIQVVIGPSKKNQFFCVGNINMLDMRIFIPFVIGMALGFITGFIFLIIIMQIKKKDYKNMEEEIITYFKSDLSLI